jgi:hypothetical protein
MENLDLFDGSLQQRKILLSYGGGVRQYSINCNGC